MKLKAISRIMLTLLLISILTLTFNIQPAKASGTIYIKADGSVEPSTAPISTVDNVTYTFTDNIYDEIVVEIDNVVIDGAGYTLEGTGSGAGIDLTGRSNVTIKNIEIKSFSAGIKLHKSANNTISGNNIIESDFGIFVVNSRNCTASDNTVSARVTDIDLHNSSYCVVMNNTANCYGHGIYLSDSPNCIVSDNTAVKTSGFSDGNCITLDNSDNCIVSGNTANKNTYGIFLAGSSNVTISNNTANNNKSGGIELENSYGFPEPQEPSNNCTIVDNIAINNDVGIYMSSSQHSIIHNNIANNNWWWGIAILSGSNKCIISGNTVNNNPWGSIIVGSYECKFNNNTINNNEHGLELADCSDNHIYNNNLINNTNQVFLREAYNNIVYHNNFINSTNQVYDWSWDNQEISLSINTWDNGYPSGGNFWSDYNGTDLYFGPYQNITGSDGIGDTRYIINENNQDNYPLMNPWTPTAPVVTATIDINPDTLNLKSRGKWITCYIELPEGYSVSDIDRTTISLNGTIPVDQFWINKPLESVVGDYDNDTIPDFMVKFSRAAVIEYLFDQNITYGNLTFTVTGELFDSTIFEASSMIRVKMTGNVIVEKPSEENSHNDHVPVIPEFPSFLILPLFMTATLLAVILYRRKL